MNWVGIILIYRTDVEPFGILEIPVLAVTPPFPAIIFLIRLLKAGVEIAPEVPEEVLPEVVPEVAMPDKLLL